MQLAKATAISLVTVFGLVNLASAGSAGRCGGTGGNNTRTLTCPDGQYVAGIGARGGGFVDEFSIACRKIPVSGQPGSLGGYKSAGPGGGTRSRSRECDNGHAVKAVIFRSGVLIDNVEGATCRARSGDGWSNQTQSFLDLDIGVGGIGGGHCSIGCPSNEALYRVTVKYGVVIDSIRGECRK
jgi:hypothetical protein